MSNTWLLLEDGSSYSVFCTAYPMPKGASKPVDAYVLAESDEAFTIAAQKAVHGLYAAALERGLAIAPTTAGFDLVERKGGDAQITGLSGGLSFALAFAKQALGRDPGHIAATGVVQAGGGIGRVRGIEAKLETALTLLGRGDILLFPRSNLDEIPDALLARIREKGIRPLPVAEMGEVLDLYSPREKSSRRPLIIWALAAAAAAIAAWAFFTTRPPDPAPAKNAIHPVPLKAAGPETGLRDPSPATPPDAPVRQEPAAAKPVKKAVPKDKPGPADPPVSPPKRRLPPPGPEGDRGFE